MKRHLIFRPVVLSLCLFALLSCGNDGFAPAPPVTGDRGELVSSISKTAYTPNELQTLTGNYKGFNTFSPLMTRAVQTYTLVYWTVDTAGTPIKASGLLAIPAGSNSDTKMLSYQHGTIFNTVSAPSNYIPYDGLSAMLASMDFIVVLPDYIGYGESIVVLHPYMHADSLAKSSIDMLRAGKNFMNSNSIGFSKQLLLGGYSEGGYAAVATHKIIQENHADEFTIVATAAGAGAYDMAGTANTLLASDSLPYAAYVAFVFKAYDEIYGFNRISEIFNSAYVDIINTKFYGDADNFDIESRLSKLTATLFQTDFLTSFRNGNEVSINTRLSENNIYDWSPQAPLRLFHGQVDDIVPYANSVTAHAAMTGYGSDVIIEVCAPTSGSANHDNCFMPYLLYMTDYFLSL